MGCRGGARRATIARSPCRALANLSAAALLSLASLVACAEQTTTSQAGASGAAATSATAVSTTSAAAKGGSLPCDAKPEYAKFDKKNGDQTVECVLAEPMKLDGHACDKGQRAGIFPSGKLEHCVIGAKEEIQGIPCKGMIRFKESGKLADCYLEADHEIGGVSCTKSLELHENGKLRRCQTAGEARKVGEVEVPAGAYVTLGEDGKVTRVEYPAASSLTFKGFKCSEASYHPTGAIKVCVTPEKVQYKGKELPLATRLCFDTDGKETTEGDPLCMKW